MYLSLHSPTRYFFLAAALLIDPTAIAWGEPVGSSCLRANLSASNFYQGEFDRESLPAFVVGDQVPVYAQKRSDGAPIRRLAFGSRVFVVEPADSSSSSRVQVADYSDVNKIYGWVDQSNLLCRRDPLRLASGIWRRVFTPASTIYKDSQGGCEDNNCDATFLIPNWHFIYGERDGRLLVSEWAQLESNTTQISGWLDTNATIQWNTATALRPSETLDDNTTESHICAYPYPESINDPYQCRPIYGSYRWLKSYLRLHILTDIGDDDTGYWRVALEDIGGNPNVDNMIVEVIELMRIMPQRNMSTTYHTWPNFFLDINQSNQIYKPPGLYIPKNQSNKVVKEVLITSDQFENWLVVLKALQQLNTSRQIREQLLVELKENISANLDYGINSNKSLGEMLHLEVGLPYALSSPVLRYSEQEIIGGMSTCELNHLAEAASRKLLLLNAVRSGSGLPTFEYEPLDELLCPNMGAKGRAIRKINQTSIALLPLASTTEYTELGFSFHISDEHLYWLPIEWLL